jgi:hypothetical protein
MATWTELEAQDEAELRKWAKALDQLNAEETAAEAEAKANIKASIAERRAKYEATRTALDDQITAQIQKWSADLDKLDAQIDAAHDKAKADLEARRSALRAHYTEGQSKLQASLTTQLNHFKTGIDELEARVAATNADARAKIAAQVAVLRKQVDATRQELEQLKETRRESWNERKARVDRALEDLKEGRKKAAAEFH